MDNLSLIHSLCCYDGREEQGLPPAWIWLFVLGLHQKSAWGEYAKQVCQTKVQPAQWYTF